MVVKWKVDGVELPLNPSTFMLTPVKDIPKRRTLDNKEVRIKPLSNKATSLLEVTWISLESEWRNRFYDMYIDDTVFTIQSHMRDNPREVWMVRIESFTSTPKRTGNRWEVQMTLEEVTA